MCSARSAGCDARPPALRSSLEAKIHGQIGGGQFTSAFWFLAASSRVSQVRYTQFGHLLQLCHPVASADEMRG